MSLPSHLHAALKRPTSALLVHCMGVAILQPSCFALILLLFSSYSPTFSRPRSPRQPPRFPRYAHGDSCFPIRQSAPLLGYMPFFRLSWLPESRLRFPDAHLIRHTAFGLFASWQLLRDDEARHRASGEGPHLLLYCELSFDDLAGGPRRTPPEYARCGARLPRLRPRSTEDGILPPVRRAGGHRTDLDAKHRDTDGAVGALH